MEINCTHIIICGAPICFQTIVFYGCNFFNGYGINTLRMSSFYITFCRQYVLRMRVCSMSARITSAHGIILILSVNVSIKSAPASAFGLKSSGTFSCAPSCYLTGRLINDIVILQKLFYWTCLKICLEL
jgi:hypothetical protein